MGKREGRTGGEESRASGSGRRAGGSVVLYRRDAQSGGRVDAVRNLFDWTIPHTHTHTYRKRETLDLERDDKRSFGGEKNARMVRYARTLTPRSLLG